MQTRAVYERGILHRCEQLYTDLLTDPRPSETPGVIVCCRFIIWQRHIALRFKRCFFHKERADVGKIARHTMLPKILPIVQISLHY
jgi:hypothetical protein